mgnify:CR=1 FL=1|jgi:cytochrome c
MSPRNFPRKETETMELAKRRLIGISMLTVPTVSMMMIGIMMLTLMTMMMGPGSAEAQDAKAGEAVFRQCATCHTLEAGKAKIGPSLHGLFGRKAGTVEGFSYSEAMKGSGIVWDEPSLAEYLKAPKKVVPGTKMTFPGLKDETKLHNLIAYLKQATQ